MVRPIRFTEEMIEEYFAKGYWTDDTTSRLWDQNATRYPDKEAFVSSTHRLTWSQVKQMSDRLAWGFIRTGLTKGDLLLLLLPNCCESYIVRVACEKAGIPCATAMMTLGEREIEYILRTFNAVATVIPRTFRSFDYYGAIHELRKGLPGLKHVLVSGDESLPGTISMDALMREPQAEVCGPSAFWDTTRISALSMPRWAGDRG